MGPDEIHIYLAFLDAVDEHRLALCRHLLEPHEQVQETRFHFERDQRRYLVTRALARTILSRYAAITPEALRFAQNAYGRPALANAPDCPIRFNISHTAGLVALAVTSGSDLGLDVENVAARDAPGDLADRFFAAAEAEALRALPVAERKRRFFEYWTLKESYIKARGMGLSLDLGKFAFRFPEAATIALDVAPELGGDGARWRFWQFEATPQHLLALCAETRGAGPQRLRFRAVVPLESERDFQPLLVRAPAGEDEGELTCWR